MLIIGSIINIVKNSFKQVEEILKNYPQIEIYSSSEDKMKLVAVFEVHSEDELEKICAELKSHDEIIDIGHHYFNSEDEIENLVDGRVRPELTAFKKRKTLIVDEQKR